MKRLILILSVIILVSCKNSNISKEQIFVRDSIHIVVPKVLIDSGYGSVVKNQYTVWDSLTKQYINKYDSLFQHLRINGKDTIMNISYNAANNQFKWKIKPDTIYYITRDTLTKTETVKNIIETPFMSKVGIFFIGGISLIVLILLVIITWKILIRRTII